MRLLYLYIPLVDSLLHDAHATSVTSLTVASYNSKFLSACTTKVRQKHFHEVVRNLYGVDVVALQKVRDRFAVEHDFRPDSWTPAGVTLNNSGDTISLLDEYEQPLDSVSYSSCKEGIEITFKEEL
ncbi:hypothetical protein [Vibrio sp. M260118]|uniref:hypothetical protein n=1 Tax=Vibrio sp. M260118 TaxID=3020896 RepID=UPI002F4147F2